MKRILYLTLTIMLCLTFFTAVTWAEEKASAASDKILSQQQVDELLQADDDVTEEVITDDVQTETVDVSDEIIETSQATEE